MTNFLTDDSADISGVPVVEFTDLAAATPLPRIELPADEVHVWLANLNQPADELKTLLAEDEAARAARFRFEKDRNAYIVARALLRKILAGYLGSPAEPLQFSYAEKGKPALAGSHQGLLEFNLAHSHGRALYAFCRGRQLGIDLEFIREDFGGEELAERFFSECEVAALRNVPLELAKEAFFNCWTRKEAYLKARGEGLSMPLQFFDVSLAPGEAAALLRNQQEPAEVTRWTMQSLSVPSGYVAALVVEGKGWSLKRFNIV